MKGVASARCWMLLPQPMLGTTTSVTMFGQTYSVMLRDFNMKQMVNMTGTLALTERY